MPNLQADGSKAVAGNADNAAAVGNFRKYGNLGPAANEQAERICGPAEMIFQVDKQKEKSMITDTKETEAPTGIE